MLKGSQVRQSGWSIEALLLDRWSPRALSGDALAEAELMPLLEAARWAPSSGNLQPWRFLYALRGDAYWNDFQSLLVEGNRLWAQYAGAMVLFLSQTLREGSKPLLTHSFDTGAAWQNFALQGYAQGLVVHGLQGFDYERARALLNVPGDYAVEAMIVVGKPGAREALPEGLRQREQPNDRRPLRESICHGRFGFPTPG